MEVINQHILQAVSAHTVVSFGIVKRLFPEARLQVLRETLRHETTCGNLKKHEYPNLSCYTLTEAGFRILGITHTPKINFSKAQAARIINVNHLRIGFTQSLIDTDIQMKWIGGTRFKRQPMFVKINNSEQILKTEATAVLSSSNSPKARIFFVYNYTELEELKNDMFLYKVYEDKNLHLKRFRLEQAPIRIIVLVPSYKTILEVKRHLKGNIYKQVLFLPTNQVQHDKVMSNKLFLNNKGDKLALLNTN